MYKTKYKYGLMVLCCVGALILSAQSDTTLLRLDILDSDILIDKEEGFENKVVSGFRIPVESNDLPFTVFVISQDEILLNGYTTIVDALSGLPGIRVSQPGSGEDGETFMMNGLYGNSYAKILVNNVPIKPFMIRALPIGAQLPIKNVERIEVFYGAAASSHGSDASAGVINIVTKENTKPNFVQANYTIGDGAYQNINVLYQTDINILNSKFGFSLYGNATQADRWKVNYSDIDFESYEFDELYESAPNYEQENGKPTVSPFPHASRLFGLELKYKKLKYESQLMYRRDHSSIGLNPTAVSYHESLSFIGERINNMRLSYSDEWGPVQVSSSVNILDYKMDKNSSIPYLAPMKLYFDAKIVEYILDFGMTSDSLRTALLNNEYSSGIFLHASSRELNAEQGFLYKTKQGHYFNFVGKYETGKGIPFIKTQTGIFGAIIPEEEEEFEEERLYSNFNGFLQGYLNFKKFKFLFDSNFGSFIKTERTQDLSTTYRFAASYLLTDKIKFRTSISNSFRITTPNNLVENLFLDLNAEASDFPTETNTYFNLGLNWHISDKALLDISYYSYGIDRHLIYTAYDSGLESFFNGDFRFHYGFTPEAATFKDINGIQVFLRSQQFLNVTGFNFDVSLDYSWGKERYNRILKFDNITSDEIGEINGVRGVPRIMAKVNLNSQLSRDLYFRLQTNYYGKGVPFSMLNYLRRDKKLETKAGVMVNSALRYQLNRYFGINVQIFNLLNTETGGIDANGTLDVLDFNPQRQCSFRLGVDYIIR